MTLKKSCNGLIFDFAPYALSGTVYGTLLNHRPAYDALAPVMHDPPYKAPPDAPVLYIKPPSALALDGDELRIPPDVDEIEIGASLGLIIGRTACRVTEETALAYVSGLIVVNDVSVPHPDYFRPSVRYKARDGFCPIGAATPLTAAIDPNRLDISIRIDDGPPSSYSTSDMRRSTQRLLTDVTEFMTLFPGDILTLGSVWPQPRAGAGQKATIKIAGLGSLANRLVRDTQ